VGLSYARHPIRVLGVDPGLTRCGVGVVEGAPGRALTTSMRSAASDRAQPIPLQFPRGGGDQFSYTAAIAAVLAVPAAVGNANLNIQVHGGIGFTWEHDAHLYLRRAYGIGQFLGGPARWLCGVVAKMSITGRVGRPAFRPVAS